VNTPVPPNTLGLAVTSKLPVTVTAADPPNVPPASSRLGSTTALVFKFSVPPPLTVTGASNPDTAPLLTFSVPPLTVIGTSNADTAVLLTFSVPPLTFSAAPEATIESDAFAFTVAPDTNSVPAPVTSEPELSIRVPPEKFSPAPTATA
jgi:hypothetical protein